MGPRGDSGDAEFVHVAHLEGMAALGMIERYWTEPCDFPGAKRVHAITRDGRHLVTKCIDERGVKKVVSYLAEARRLSGLVVEEGEFEEKEEVFEE